MNDLDQRLNETSNERSVRGHLFRYMLASGFTVPGDVVVDAACGTGYGKALLREGVEYIGIDNDATVGPSIQADLCEWQPDFDFDVFLGFETIEHLIDYHAYVAAAKRARKWIVVSTPVVPTTHLNEHHLHNFAVGELASLFVDGEWSYFQGLLQPSELSEICIFGKKQETSGVGWPE